MTVPPSSSSGLRRSSNSAGVLTPWDVSKSRIERLQKLCRDLDLQGLLFIPGVDGRSNWGSQVFLNWALLGKTGRELDGEPYVEAEYDALEDSVVLITPQGFSMFYSREVSGIIDPVLAHLTGAREYCTSQAEMDDSDLFERRKILSFLDMLSSSVNTNNHTNEPSKRRLGMPFPLGFDDARDLESWPLIQAYALDEMGAKGFFTATFDVQDITPHLQDLIYGVDAAFVDRIVTGSIQTLRHHLSTTVAVAEGSDLTWSSRSLLTEEDLSEPLATLYEFGHVRDSPAAYAQATRRGPRVLLGTRTALVTDREARPSKASSVEGCFHMVVEGEDPSSAIRFCRTYFLRCNSLPAASLREASLLPGQMAPTEEGTQNSAQAQAGRFHAAYECLVAAIKSLPKQQVTPWELGPRLREAVGGGVGGAWESLSVTVEAVNAGGQPLEPGRSVDTVCLVYVRLVASLGAEGSVAVGDTALYQPSPTPSYAALLKDGALPYFRAWAGPGAEDFYAVRLARSLLDGHLASELELGQTVGPLFSHCAVLLPSAAYPVLDCQLRLFESGLAILRTGRLPILLSLNDGVKDIRLCETTSSSTQVTVMQLRLTQPLAGAVPFASPTDYPTSLAVVLSQAGSSLSHTILSLMPSWRLAVEQRHGISPMEGGHLLPELSTSYQAFLGQSGSSQAGMGSRQLVDDLFNRELFMARKDQRRMPAPLLARKTALTTELEATTMVTILVGLPGSGVLDVARQVVRFASSGAGSEEEWQYVPVALPTSITEDSPLAAHLSLVSQALTRALERSPRRLVLAVVGGCLSLPALCIHLLQQHQARIKLASSSLVVSLDRMVEGPGAGPAAGSWLPGLWEQATEGWCSSLLLTDETHNTTNAAQGGDGSSSGIAAADVGRVRQRFRLANRTAPILQASRGCIESDVLQELLRTDRFDTQEAERRHVLGPEWESIDPLSLCCPLPAMRSDSGGQTKLLLALDCGLDADRLNRCLSELFQHATQPTVPAAASGVGAADDTSPPPAGDAAFLKQKGDEEEGLRREDMEELEKDIKSWAAERRAIMPDGVVQSVHGVVCLSPSSSSKKQPQQCHFLEASGKHVSLIQAAPSLVPSSMPQLELCGYKLRSQTLTALLRLALPYQRKARPLRTRESLTKEEIQLVCSKAEAEGRPVPDGWWFDGNSYLDGFGSRIYQRPDLEDMLKQHLHEVNVQIQADNAKLNATTNAAVF